MRGRGTSLLIGWMLLLLLGSACERRPLEEEKEEPLNYAEIQVVFDWQRSALRPTGMTALFYPEDGSKPQEYLTGYDTSTVRLRRGVYRVIAFNQARDEFDGISFRGMERFETFEAYCKPLSARNESGADNYREHPDILAVDTVQCFEVTQQMINHTTQMRSRAGGRASTKAEVAATLIFSPVKVVAQGSVRIHLKGLNYVHSAQGCIRGLAESMMMGTLCSSAVPATHRFTYTTPEYYPGSTINGSVMGRFATFGLLNGGVDPVQSRTPSVYNVEFNAILRDNEKSRFDRVFDVTSHIYQEVDVNLNIRIDMELGLPLQPGSDPTVEVPEVKIDKGGFDVSIEDWGDEIVIEK